MLIASLVLTLGAWSISRSQVQAQNELRFDREANQILTLVEERLRKYEDALWGGVALYDASDSVSYSQWLTFSESLHIEKKYPGINGIGVIYHLERSERDSFVSKERQMRPNFDIHPPHDNTELLPITFIEPAASNAAAVGLDMAHEKNRYTAALKAWESGAAQMTGPIVLVQDEAQTPGFLFYTPFYTERIGSQENENGAQDKTPKGLVYAPFVVNKLMQGTLDQVFRHVNISIHDDADSLYSENIASSADFDPVPLFERTVDKSLYGRNWTFDIRTNLDFRRAASNIQPQLILIGGLTIDLLLLSLFLALSRANRRALMYADQATEELQTTAAQLQRSNEDLEKFAYVASHDLKTPLRGISDLTEYLHEDLNEYIASKDANPDVSKNIGRLHQQADRMESLIKGILAYSSVNGGAEDLRHIDCNAIVEQIRSDLGVSENVLSCATRLPQFTTQAGLLEQVLSNLVSNAFKYHDDLPNAKIEIWAEEQGNYYHFFVRDNGPGIDPRYHARIFDVFQTLQPKTGNNTGIGLSIVKKAVETMSGTISVKSAKGEGATFEFTWLKEANKSTVQQLNYG